MRSFSPRRFALLLTAAALGLAGCEATDASSPLDPLAESAKKGKNVQPQTCDVTVPDDQSTVQAAVDAASPRDVVCVNAGTYPEQVVIDKDLTLQGFGDPVIRAPASPGQFTIAESGSTWEPVVFAYGGTESGGAVSGPGTVKVAIQGLVVDGDDRDPADRAVGILLRNVEGQVSGNTVGNMLVGGDETMGIIAYGDSRLAITGNHVSEYERGGIGANGDGGAHPAPDVVIADNHVVGTTGIGEAWAPNGIQIGFGATGRISGNVVEDNRWAGEAWSASCILVFESDGVQVMDNEVDNCDVGLSVSAWGWFLPSADNLKLTGNAVSNSSAAVVLQAVAFPGFSMTNPSVSNVKVVNNELVAGAIGDVGIAVAATDLSPDYDPIADNNKLIRNDITGFPTPVADQGTDSKVQANRPATP